MQRIIQRDNLLKVLILLGVLAGSLGFGYIAGKMSLRIILVGLAGIGGLIAVLTISTWFNYFPFILLIMAAISPLALDTGTQTTISDGMVFSAAIVGIWILNQIFGKKPDPINLTKEERFLVIFLMIVPVSLIWSWLFKDQGLTYDFGFVIVQIATAFTMILLPLVMLVIRKIDINEERRQRIIILFIIIGALAYFEKTSFKLMNVEDRGLFPMWITGISLSLILFNQKLSVYWKIILGMITAGWLYYSFYLSATWLSGWLPALITISVLVFIRSRKLFFFIVFLLAIIFVLNLGYFSELLETEIAESGISRPLAWYRNIQLDLKHILFGTGPAGYKLYYEYYFQGQDVHLSHNNYLDIFAQTGIFGILSYLLFFITLLKSWIEKLLQNIDRQDWISAKYAVGVAGLIAVLVAMGMGDWLIPFPYTQGIGGFDYIVYSWIILGLIESSREGETKT